MALLLAMGKTGCPGTMTPLVMGRKTSITLLVWESKSVLSLKVLGHIGDTEEIGKQRNSFKRFFQSNTNSCFLEVFQNAKGVFLKISVLKKNIVKMVIIPEEVKVKGWKEFEDCLSNLLRRKSTRRVEEIHVNENKKEELLKIKQKKVASTNAIVTFVNWSLENQSKDVKIECTGSWIGVEGLPINPWKMKTMRKIEALCRRPLDVDKETTEMNFLPHIKLKLEGDSDGFIPQTLAVTIDNFHLVLKFFKLNEKNYRFNGGFNTLWFQDMAMCRLLKDNDEGFEECSIEGTEKDDMVSENQTLVENHCVEEEVEKMGMEQAIGDSANLEVDSRSNLNTLIDISSPETRACGGEKSNNLKRIFIRLFQGLSRTRVPNFVKSPELGAFSLLKNMCQYDHSLGREIFGRNVEGPRSEDWGFDELHSLKPEELIYYRNKPFSLVLGRDCLATTLSNRIEKENKDYLMTGRIGSGKDEKALSVEKSHVLVINEFFKGLLGSIKPKARESFKSTIISFWEDFEMNKRMGENKVLHKDGEDEQEEEVNLMDRIWEASRRIWKKAIDLWKKTFWNLVRSVTRQMRMGNSSNEDEKEDQEDIICDM
ncbi:hypothetical protein F8388_000750 [Cannabis sativa]|uniref:DUF4283 domain-containing protein n=1 Tax=Cannabis sativa TaxID=3483 RepID=A0A7J6ECY9_CANSA|nr:hypothetical protein F8388_000750 [Cannabis sativa]